MDTNLVQQQRHRAWSVVFGQIGEVDLFSSEPLTVGELERELGMRFPQHPVQRLRPLQGDPCDLPVNGCLVCSQPSVNPHGCGTLQSLGAILGAIYAHHN